MGPGGRHGTELDVAGALRGDEDREAARRRRAVALGLGAVALLLGLGLAARIAQRPSLADLVKEERANWANARTLSPADDPGPQGEQVVPFEGFAIAADSEPPGAEVSVDGRALGQTPLAAGVACVPGQPLVVRFRFSGKAVRERTTACRADGMVKLRATP